MDSYLYLSWGVLVGFPGVPISMLRAFCWLSAGCRLSSFPSIPPPDWACALIRENTEQQILLRQAPGRKDGAGEKGVALTCTHPAHASKSPAPCPCSLQGDLIAQGTQI